MTVEQYVPHVSVIEEGKEHTEIHIPQQRSAQRIGHTALEGFTIMENVISPWQELRSELGSRIIGQPAAIDAVVSALEGNGIRMPSDKRPIANLAFLGPTGVGKSETAKSLAEFLSGNRGLIKIDCSDFSHGHEISSLTGAPPGYIGHDQKPILNKQAVEGYGTVILFDEIEKASGPLFNLMLQIMEDGALQLKNGQVTSFRDAIIILTSNLGAKEMAAQLSESPLGFSAQDKPVDTKSLERVAKKSFKEHFRPEFVNRLSNMIVFHPLDRESLSEVFDTKVAQKNVEFEQQLGVRLSISEGARAHLLDVAENDKHMGARPLIRALDDHVYTPLGRYHGAEAAQEGTHIKVFHADETGKKVYTGDSPLVFAAKHDASLVKPVEVPAEPLAIAAASEALPPSVYIN